MAETAQKATESQRLLAWLREREDKMAALLAELVALPTENPPGNQYAQCAELLEKRLAQKDFACERLGAKGVAAENDPAPCLSASYGNGNRTIYFHGHYDVVPAQSQEQFHPKRKEHFVFGRGACDMKGGIVSMLYAMLALRECGVALDGRVRLVLVPDEETGGARGSVRLAKLGLLGRDGVAMFTAEPTSGLVWHANRGAITLRVDVFGNPAHVGLQHKGENAFERMVRVVQRVQELKREVEQRVTQAPVGPEQKRNSILLIGGASGGGTNFNVVPEKCWFTIDRRINPEEDLATEKAGLVEVLEECRREIPLEWEVLQEAPAATSAAPTEAGTGAAPRAKEAGTAAAPAAALADAIAAVTGTAASFVMCPGLLETRFYVAAGVAAYAYGPGLLAVAHGPDEYVDLRRIVECAAVYALAARKLLAPSAGGNG